MITDASSVYRAAKPCPRCGAVIPASWTEDYCARCWQLKEEASLTGREFTFLAALERAVQKEARRR